MLLITPWCTCTVQMHMHAWLFKPGQVAKAREFGNGYWQTLALSSARDLTKCEAHRVSGITAVLGVRFLTAVLSPRTRSPSLPVHLGQFMWLALKLGTNLKHLTPLNKEIDKHITGRGPEGQRWLYRVQWEQSHCSRTAGLIHTH